MIKRVALLWLKIKMKEFIGQSFSNSFSSLSSNGKILILGKLFHKIIRTSLPIFSYIEREEIFLDKRIFRTRIEIFFLEARKFIIASRQRSKWKATLGGNVSGQGGEALERID